MRRVVITVISVLLILSMVPTSNEKNFQYQEGLDNHDQPISDASGSKSLADSPWPCYKGNLRNTGLSRYNISKNPGRIEWEFQTKGLIYSTPAIDADGTIYIGSVDSYVYAIRPNGSMKWKYDTESAIYSSPTIGSDGTIYIGSLDNHLYALNPNGTLKWKYCLEKGGYMTAMIATDGTIYFGSWDGYFCAINPDGTLKWQISIEGTTDDSPAIGVNGTIYFGTTDNILYALSPDGDVIWEYEAGDVIWDSPSIDENGTIYFGSRDGNLSALYPNGTLKWKYRTGDWIQTSPSIGPDNSIYFGSNDNFTYALNPNGTLKWRFETREEVKSSPSISADGIIIFGSDDSYLYAVNSNGSLRWETYVNWAVRTTPVISAEGKIYVTTLNDFFYSVGYMPPPTPEDFTAQVGDGYVNLSWTASDNLDSYGTNYVISREREFDNYRDSYLIKGSTSFYNDTEVINGYSYLYNIKTIDEFGQSPLSNDIKVTPIGRPTVPLNFSVIPGDKMAILKFSLPEYWGGAKDNLSINIYMGEQNTEIIKSDVFKINEPSDYTNQFLYSSSHLINGKKYFFAISASNDYYEGPKTEILNATPKELDKSTVNLNISIIDGKVVLNWSLSPDDNTSSIKKTYIYRGETKESLGLIATVMNTTYIDENATNRNVFFYRIIIVDNTGVDSISNTVQIPEYEEIEPYPLPEENDEEKDRTNISLWVILFILIFSLITIALIGLIYYKRKTARKKPNEESASSEIEEEDSNNSEDL